MAGPNIKVSPSKYAVQVLAIIPSLDQKPPIKGIPIIDIEPNIIAVAVTGSFDARPPIFLIS